MAGISLNRLPKIDRITIALSYILRTILLIAVGYATWEHRWLLLFLSSFIFILTFVPSAIARNIKVNLPVEFESVAILFIFVSLFMGDLRGYYYEFPWWDVMLHGISGLLLGFIGFLILYILYDRHKLKASPMLIALFSFCFAMAVGAVWEIVEFAIDSALGTHMQHSSLVDTMWDLILDGIGAGLVSLGGFLYVKGNRSRIIRPMLRHFISKNKQLYKKKGYK